MGICRICGMDGDGLSFEDWVKDTFTNYDQLFPGSIVCDGCMFWFGQKSVELQKRMGKDKPQKMQNYSHFKIGGEWIPVGKGDKRIMATLLLTQPFPTLAAIAVSGQKHIAFRARRNPPGQTAGWVQFEEQAVWVEADYLREVLGVIEDLYTVFSKREIESGRYHPSRIRQFGIERWTALESGYIRPMRCTTLFQLALFLAQRSEDGDNKGNGGDPAENYMEGRSTGLQEPLSDDDLGAVRERNPGSKLHEQPGEIYQFPLFPHEG